MGMLDPHSMAGDCLILDFFRISCYALTSAATGRRRYDVNPPDMGAVQARCSLFTAPTRVGSDQ